MRSRKNFGKAGAVLRLKQRRKLVDEGEIRRLFRKTVLILAVMKFVLLLLQEHGEDAVDG